MICRGLGTARTTVCVRTAAAALALVFIVNHVASAAPPSRTRGPVDYGKQVQTIDQLLKQGGSVTDFLDSQRYDPSTADDATYAVTFDVCGRGFAKVLADTRLRTLDLADLYGMPWDRFQCVGFTSFWVSRIDGVNLSVAELERLEQDITKDLQFDYGEDELDFWFDPDTYKGAMLVSVQDHVELA
jgi:hypothetical protein